MTARPEARGRRPLARTKAPPRWLEYRGLLLAAQAFGYAMRPVEDWVLHGADDESIIILRHDVDQHPRSAIPMLEIEQDLGVTSTWYFRWRTASEPIIHQVREAGGQVGFHYESLTRLVLERKLTPNQVDDALIAEARAALRREITAFQDLFGPIRSVCPHGDTRAPGVENQLLLRGEQYLDYGVLFDGNAAMARRPLGLWLTDRSLSEGGWADGRDPHEVLAAGTSPILLLTHPNNWCSGRSLWVDRIRAAALPTPRPGYPARFSRSVRTGDDVPPQPQLKEAGRRQSSRGVDFAPVAVSLRREILRFYFDADKRLVDHAGLTTLATNADLAESRVSALEHGLRQVGVVDLEGLRVLDVGCGFGALSLVFAARGATVVAVDPNAARMRVGRAVAEHHDLPVCFVSDSMVDMRVEKSTFDVVVMNNSLCYVTARDQRRRGLEAALDGLKPGGALLIRNPNRFHPVDQFTGIPLLGTLPPFLAQGASRLLRRSRSNVRLLSNRAARRELRRAGFVNVRTARRPGESRLRAAVAGYQHLVGLRPSACRGG